MPLTLEALSERYGSFYRWYVTVTMMLGCISMVLSATIVNVALPDIMGEFGMGQDKAQWLSTAFLAAMTATMLGTAWGLAAFGARTAYIGALLLFIVGSLMGGLAGSEDILILARTLQGAAAGMVQPLSMVLIFRSFPPARRGTAMGVFGVGVIMAPALGPALGGFLIDEFSWRAVFYLVIPSCLAGIVLAPLFLPEREHQGPPPAFDGPGFMLISAAIAAFLTALGNGQRQGWDSAFVESAFDLALGCAVAFIIWERRTPTPILALSLYLNPRFLAASVVAFILGLGLYGSTYLVPLFVQTVQGYTATASGLLLMPAGVVLGVVFPLAGRLSDRVRPHGLIMSGLLIFGISSFLMVGADTSTDFVVFAVWVVVGRIGLGFILPSLNVGALRVLEPAMVSQGAGAINFVRQLGGAIGVSILSVYLEQQTANDAAAFNDLQSGNHAAADALDQIALLLGQAGLVDHVNTAVRTQEAYQFFSSMISAQASVLGFRESFLLVAIIFFAALLPAWFMRPRSLGS